MAEKTERELAQANIAENRKAYHDYHILQEWEAGVVLLGTEVKSIREGRVNLRDSYARIEKGELWLCNVNVSAYSHRGYADHEPMQVADPERHHDGERQGDRLDNSLVAVATGRRKPRARREQRLGLLPDVGKADVVVEQPLLLALALPAGQRHLAASQATQRLAQVGLRIAPGGEGPELADLGGKPGRAAAPALAGVEPGDDAGDVEAAGQTSLLAGKGEGAEGVADARDLLHRRRRAILVDEEAAIHPATVALHGRELRLPLDRKLGRRYGPNTLRTARPPGRLRAILPLLAPEATERQAQRCGLFRVRDSQERTEAFERRKSTERDEVVRGRRALQRGRVGGPAVEQDGSARCRGRRRIMRHRGRLPSHAFAASRAPASAASGRRRRLSGRPSRRSRRARSRCRRRGPRRRRPRHSDRHRG